jgi:hypothetical protein
MSRLDPFLVETSEEFGDYLALSYCWGKERRSDMMLFSSKSKGRRGQPTPTPNMEAHKTRISFDIMPKTLQDAVIVTRHLRVRYLWIDALCIVQGDNKEWEKEHDNLVDIYANARLVIAADAAEGLESGFLHPNNSTAQYRDLRQSENSCPSPLSLDEPLNHRAWSLSEAIFSTRIVHFTSVSMIWECNSVRQCTLGCSLDFKQEEEERDDNPFRFFRQPALAKHYIQSDLYRKWNTLIEHFTRRQINSTPNETHKDAQRLVALSRLAKRFLAILNDVHGYTDTYLAGIWKGNLPTSLLWSVESGLERYPNVSWRRPSVVRAPSWSWAAVEGPVSLETPQTFESGMRIEEATVAVCSDRDPFGQVREGRLVVHGKALHKLRVARGDRTAHICDVSGPGFDGGWNFVCDVPLCDEDLRGEFSCLVVGEAKEHEGGDTNTYYAMLLLRPVPSTSQTFTRIGISSRHMKCMGVSALLDALVEELVVLL